MRENKRIPGNEAQIEKRMNHLTNAKLEKPFNNCRAKEITKQIENDRADKQVRKKEIQM